MDDEKLILEVQKNEILYDKTNRMFKDITKKARYLERDWGETSMQW